MLSPIYDNFYNIIIMISMDENLYNDMYLCGIKISLD